MREQDERKRGKQNKEGRRQEEEEEAVRYTIL